MPEGTTPPITEQLRKTLEQKQTRRQFLESVGRKTTELSTLYLTSKLPRLPNKEIFKNPNQSASIKNPNIKDYLKETDQEPRTHLELDMNPAIENLIKLGYKGENWQNSPIHTFIELKKALTDESDPFTSALAHQWLGYYHFSLEHPKFDYPAYLKARREQLWPQIKKNRRKEHISYFTPNTELNNGRVDIIGIGNTPNTQTTEDYPPPPSGSSQNTFEKMIQIYQQKLIPDLNTTNLSVFIEPTPTYVAASALHVRSSIQVSSLDVLNQYPNIWVHELFHAITFSDRMFWTNVFYSNTIDQARESSEFKERILTTNPEKILQTITTVLEQINILVDKKEQIQPQPYPQAHVLSCLKTILHPDHHSVLTDLENQVKDEESFDYLLNGLFDTIKNNPDLDTTEKIEADTNLSPAEKKVILTVLNKKNWKHSFQEHEEETKQLLQNITNPLEVIALIRDNQYGDDENYQKILQISINGINHHLLSPPKALSKASGFFSQEDIDTITQQITTDLVENAKLQISLCRFQELGSSINTASELIETLASCHNQIRLIQELDNPKSTYFSSEFVEKTYSLFFETDRMIGLENEKSLLENKLCNYLEMAFQKVRQKSIPADPKQQWEQQLTTNIKDLITKTITQIPESAISAKHWLYSLCYVLNSCTILVQDDTIPNYDHVLEIAQHLSKISQTLTIHPSIQNCLDTCSNTKQTSQTNLKQSFETLKQALNDPNFLQEYNQLSSLPEMTFTKTYIKQRYQQIWQSVNNYFTSLKNQTSTQINEKDIIQFLQASKLLQILSSPWKWSVENWMYYLEQKKVIERTEEDMVSFINNTVILEQDLDITSLTDAIMKRRENYQKMKKTLTQTSTINPRDIDYLPLLENQQEEVASFGYEKEKQYKAIYTITMAMKVLQKQTDETSQTWLQDLNQMQQRILKMNDEEFNQFEWHSNPLKLKTDFLCSQFINDFFYQNNHSALNISIEQAWLLTISSNQDSREYTEAFNNLILDMPQIIQARDQTTKPLQEEHILNYVLQNHEQIDADFKQYLVINLLSGPKNRIFYASQLRKSYQKHLKKQKLEKNWH